MGAAPSHHPPGLRHYLAHARRRVRKRRALLRRRAGHPGRVRSTVGRFARGPRAHRAEPPRASDHARRSTPRCPGRGCRRRQRQPPTLRGRLGERERSRAEQARVVGRQPLPRVRDSTRERAALVDSRRLGGDPPELPRSERDRGDARPLIGRRASLGPMLVRSTLMFASFCLAGCSLLAPSDDELLGGAKDAGVGAAGSGGTGAGNTGGTGGGGTAGSAGAPTGGTSSGGTSSGGTSSGGTSSGGTSSGGTSSGGTSSGGTSSGGTGGTTCVPKSGDATALPRAMYLLADRSSSMSDQNKFSYTGQGINAFALTNKAAGIDFGMQYFGLEAAGTCAGGGYSTPAVGFGTLPGLASQISTSFSTTAPNGATPLEGAVNGGALAGSQYLSSKPAVQFDVVMITDLSALSTGGGCAANPAVSTAIVASTWPAMSTHVIALPNASMSLVNLLADAGGTVTAQTAGTAASVAAALERAVTPCRFSAPAGVSLAQVSLKITGSVGILKKQVSAGACGDDAGWFEHAGGMVLCPATCHDLASGSAGKITYATTCP